MAFTQRGRPDINVTPLIDVLLVLLVIFLIVIPHLIKYEEAHTPTAPELGGEVVHSLVIRVQPDLSVVLVDDGVEIPLAASELTAGLRAHLREQTHAVFVELDEEVRWEDVISTVDTVRGLAPATPVALQLAER
jgi:biopolymer transport protein ExbD